jgi:aminoglycoside phosphotransferase (APT) family kinase protein
MRLPLTTGELCDSALPTLAEVLDPASAAAGLRRAWRTADRAVTDVRIGRRADTKYAPGAACVIVYYVTVERGDGSLEPGFGVAEARPGGSAYRRLADDPALPSAGAAADAGRMAARLRALRPPGEPEGSVRAVPVRYKPGRTCVVRYELGDAATAFGKVMAEGAERQASILRQLADAGGLRVPPLLAVWPDLGMTVQAAVTATGDLTATLAGSGQAARETWLRRAGRAVAALHAASVTPAAPVVRWHDDLGELAGYRPLFSALAPGLLPELDRAVSELADAAAALPPARERLGHGALRTDQLLADSSGRISLLDLDGVCRADPARDLGNMLGYLRWRGIRRPQDAAWTDAARPLLIEGYAAVADVPDPAWLELFQAVTMLRIAGRRLRSLAVPEWNRLPELLRRARQAV